MLINFKRAIFGITLAYCLTNCTQESIEPEQPVQEVSVSTKTNMSSVLATTSTFLFNETVEGSTPFSTAHDWDVGSWQYALQFVTTPAFRENHSARFEIRKDQPLVASGKRSEITIVKGKDGDIAKDTWYSFAVYFPKVGYEYDDTREIINQWYQDGSPATSLRTQRDRLLLESGNTSGSRKKYDIGPIVKDTWHTVVMHFIHSYKSDGLIELWYDGEKRLTINGGNMYDTFLPKWKIGLYKSSFKDGTSKLNRRIIYFDNVRVGNEAVNVSVMNPAN